MYIKLGTLNLAYHQETNDWMIMAEVLDSSMSFENPILVRTTDELDIWFGKDFSEYEYLTDFLNIGITLFLYKPINQETTGSKETYIDLSSYTKIGIDKEDYLTSAETSWIIDFLNDPERYKFKVDDEKDVWYTVINNNILVKHIGKMNNRIYCTSEYLRERLMNYFLGKLYQTENPEFEVLKDGEKSWCIFTEDNNGKYEDIVSIDLLPQNLNKSSKSLDNRDTLIIGSTIPYSYADYRTGEEGLGIYKEDGKYLEQIDEDIIEITRDKLDGISEGLQTSFYQFTKNVMKEGDYIVLPSDTTDKHWVLLYCGNLPEEDKIEKIDNNNRYEVYPDDPQDFIESIEECLGYDVIQDGDTIITYSPQILPVLNYYSCKELDIIPNIDLTFKKISDQQIKNNSCCFEFWSKTIGRGSEYRDEDYITVQIEKSNISNYYRFTLSRYSYSETFEGPLVITDPGKEIRIDNLITNNSKLVYCRYMGGEISELGEYKLMGATIEETDPTMYLYSLDTMFSPDVDTAYPDFLLIPDKYKFMDPKLGDKEITVQYKTRVREETIGKNIEKTIEYLKEDDSPILDISDNQQFYKFLERYNYTIEIPDPDSEIISDTLKYTNIRIYNCHPCNYNEVYEKLLEYSKMGDFQVLLENDSEDFYYNYEDPENRLLYFYNYFYLFDETRPGYFLFVNGIIGGEFSASIKDLNYNCPPKNEGEDEYGKSDLEISLAEKKSNYLISNNQYYYYEKLQNGKSYTTTGLMRFVAGKISRELQKKKWNYLGQQLTGKIRDIITDILKGIEIKYSMVKLIQMTEFELEPSQNLLRIKVETYTYDLVDNNLTLDITLDYNNINNSN